MSVLPAGTGENNVEKGSIYFAVDAEAHVVSNVASWGNRARKASRRRAKTEEALRRPRKAADAEEVHDQKRSQESLGKQEADPDEPVSSRISGPRTMDLSNIGVSDLPTLLFWTKNFLIAEALDFLAWFNSQDFRQRKTAASEDFSQLMLRRMCIRDITNRSGGEDSLAEDHDDGADQNDLSSSGSTSTSRRSQRASGEVSVAQDNDLERADTHQTTTVLVEPLFRLLLGLLVQAEVKRAFAEPEHIFSVWHSYGILEDREHEEAVKIIRTPCTSPDIAGVNRKANVEVDSHSRPTAQTRLISSDNDEEGLLLMWNLPKLYGRRRFGFANSLWDIWHFANSPQKFFHNGIKIELTNVIPSTVGRGLSLYWTRISAITTSVRDDALKLEFIGRGPSARHYLIERWQNVTEHGFNGVKHICSYPGSLVLPFYSKTGEVVAAKRLKSREQLRHAEQEDRGKDHSEDSSSPLFEIRTPNLDMASLPQKLFCGSLGHFPLADPPDVTARLIGAREPSDGTDGSRIQMSGGLPAYPVDVARQHNRLRRFLWNSRFSYLQWLLTVATLAMHIFLPVEIQNPVGGGLEEDEPVERFLDGTDAAFETTPETGNHFFTALDPLLILLAFGVRSLHLFGKKFSFVDQVGRKALERVSERAALQHSPFGTYADCLLQRIDAAEQAALDLRRKARCDHRKEDLGLVNVPTTTSTVTRTTVREDLFPPSRAVQTVTGDTMGLWADDAFALPIPDGRYSMDALDAALVNVFRNIYAHEHRQRDGRDLIYNCAGTRHQSFYAFSQKSKSPLLEQQASQESAVVQKFFVDIGIGRMAGDYQSRYLQTFENWNGVMIDMIGSLTTRLGYHARKVTPENILDVLKDLNVPKNFELFSIHIDGYDWHVVRKLLQNRHRHFNPRVLLIQSNSGYFYPDRFWFPLDLPMVPRYKRVNGTSISAFASGKRASSTRKSRKEQESSSSARRTIAALQQMHSEPYEREHGHHKAYSSSARGLQRLGNAFGYRLVYFGWLSVILVREDAVWPDAQHVDDLFALCQRYVLSPRGRDRAWPASRHMCHETELKGYTDAELADLYYLGDSSLSDADIRDPAKDL
ncbi:unnamed protein product [Amoebophrya sp. A25]|nr:unnamed protein product [Amoebophrya sp. A25]|eukprot:GSA25T00014345001.1